MVKHKNILSLSLLGLLIFASSIIHLSEIPWGTLHIALQILKGLLIISAWGTFYYFIKTSIFDKYASIYKKEIPRLAFFATRLLLTLCAVLSVIVFVLGKSIFSLVALGGLVSAGLTFALGELILDAFSGVILETESPFELGDWIKTLDGQEGKVVTINWRTVILENVDGYVIVIPHRKIAQGFINYSKPQRTYWNSIEFTLDQEIPIPRALRILQAAAMSAESDYHLQCNVAVVNVSGGDITYNIRYEVSDYIWRRLVRNDIIESVTRHLQEYNLHYPEDYIEYSLVNKEKVIQVLAPLKIEDLIRRVEYFDKLPKSLVTKLSQNSVCHSFNKGDKIVSEGEKGQSIFLIAEGVVEVSIAYTEKKGEKRQKPLFRLGYPDYFGEMALLLNDKRSATVIALMDTVVYEISQDVLKIVLKENPEIFEKLVKQARVKKEKNKLEKHEMKQLGNKEMPTSKGFLSNIEKFFK